MINQLNSKKTLVLVFLTVFLFLLGLYGSLKVVLHIPLESDMVQQLTLWHGVHKYGWKFLALRHYATDNWLMSIIPIQFLLFLLFGTQPVIVVVYGWFVFVLSVLFSGFIAWQLRLYKSAFIIPLLIIFVNRYAYYSVFVAHPVSHNTTNLYGLLSLIFFIAWLKKPKWSWITLIIATELIGGLSDPWAYATYVLPMFIVVASLLYKPSDIRYKDVFALLLSIGGMIVTIITLILLIVEVINPHGNHHVSDVLKNNAYSISHALNHYASRVISNAHILYTELGKLFILIPSFISHSSYVYLLSLLLVLVLFLSLAIISLNKLRLEQRALILFVYVSIVITMLSFLVFRIPGARHLINILYLAIIFLVVLTESSWRYLPKLLKTLAVLVAMLFCISGIASNINDWLKPGFPTKDPNSMARIAFLKQHHLYYGYAGYVGFEPLVVTTLTNNEIIIRSVTFNLKSGRMEIGRFSKLKDRSIAKKHYDNYFVVVAKRSCPNVKLCVKALSAQFGVPKQILHYNNTTNILIWPYPLVTKTNVALLKRHF